MRQENSTEELFIGLGVPIGATAMLFAIIGVIVFIISMFGSSPPWKSANIENLKNEIHSSHLLANAIIEQYKSNPITYYKQYHLKEVYVQGYINRIFHNGIVKIRPPASEIVVGRYDFVFCQLIDTSNAIYLKKGDNINITGKIYISNINNIHYEMYIIDCKVNL